MVRIALGGSILMLAALLGCSGPAAFGPGGAAEPVLGGPPVRMSLPRLAGGSLALHSLRGKPVLITLFTTWSLDCQLEAPGFVRLDERFRGQGLAVIGIALDSGGTSPAKLVKLYVEEVGFRFPVLLAAPDNLELVGGLGQTKAVPRTVLLDGAGHIVLNRTGVTRFQVLEKGIVELLGKPAP